ncbi:uncharacterized protein DEA37_0009490, partial [Paragonimus westermani]
FKRSLPFVYDQLAELRERVAFVDSSRNKTLLKAKVPHPSQQRPFEFAILHCLFAVLILSCGSLSLRQLNLGFQRAPPISNYHCGMKFNSPLRRIPRQVCWMFLVFRLLHWTP